MEISLKLMTNELCRAFYQEFVMDPALFMDPSQYKPYVYEEASCDAYFRRYQAMGRVHLAVMLEEKPIGEVVLKAIDWEQKFCTMGITMLRDDYKNRGFGTQAERLTLQYAFGNMGMKTVFADSVLRNVRSQHVLQKVGFVRTHQDDTFVYYRCDKSSRKCSDNGDNS